MGSLESLKRYSERPPWDIYFINVARLVSTRSTCIRRQVGAIIVREKRILTTGYNGAPVGVSHCTDDPGKCLRAEGKIPSGERQELCRGLHAEQNAIIQGAAFGVSLKGGELYCTHQPCITCAKMLINAGINRVVFTGSYPDDWAIELFNEGKILLERIAVE